MAGEIVTLRNKQTGEVIKLRRKEPEVVEEMHPELGTGTRALIQNVAPSKESAVKYLQKRGWDARLVGDEIALRKPGEPKFHRVDPSKLEWRDLLDLGDEILSGAAMVGGGVLAVAAGLPTTGPGAIGTAALGGAGGAAAAEGIRRGLGGLAGFEQEGFGETAKDIGIEGALGGAFGAGGEAAGQAFRAAKPYIARGLGKASRAFKRPLRSEAATYRLDALTRLRQQGTAARGGAAAAAEPSREALKTVQAKVAPLETGLKEASARETIERAGFGQAKARLKEEERIALEQAAASAEEAIKAGKSKLNEIRKVSIKETFKRTTKFAPPPRPAPTPAAPGAPIPASAGPVRQPKGVWKGIWEVADEMGVDPNDLQVSFREGWEAARTEIKEIQRQHSRAMARTGLNQRKIGKLENSGRDYSSVPGFDDAADELASEFGWIGAGASAGEDVASRLWQFLKAGPPKLVSREDRGIIEQIARQLPRRGELEALEAAERGAGFAAGAEEFVFGSGAAGQAAKATAEHAAKATYDDFPRLLLNPHYGLRAATLERYPEFLAINEKWFPGLNPLLQGQETVRESLVGSISMLERYKRFREFLRAAPKEEAQRAIKGWFGDAAALVAGHPDFADVAKSFNRETIEALLSAARGEVTPRVAETVLKTITTTFHGRNLPEYYRQAGKAFGEARLGTLGARKALKEGELETGLYGAQEAVKTEAVRAGLPRATTRLRDLQALEQKARALRSRVSGVPLRTYGRGPTARAAQGRPAGRGGPYADYRATWLGGRIIPGPLRAAINVGKMVGARGAYVAGKGVGLLAERLSREIPRDAPGEIRGFLMAVRRLREQKGEKAATAALYSLIRQDPRIRRWAEQQE